MKTKTSPAATPLSIPSAIPSAATEASITLYTGADYTKKASKTYHQEVAKLPKGIDNEVSSCIITSGIWILFHHPNFEGGHVRLGPGHYPNPRAMGIQNNSVSSIRPIPTMTTTVNHI